MHKPTYCFFIASYKHTICHILFKRGISNIWENGKRKEHEWEMRSFALLHALSGKGANNIRRQLCLRWGFFHRERMYMNVRLGYGRAINL